jgi:glyoxylase-like metal-dependent hydrolase (beta-lactamase superfamily II)
VDSGLAGTPEEVIIPYMEGIGLTLEDVDEVIISHADVDHCGGNRALKERHPTLWFSCGEADRPYVESNRVMLAEIYRWSEPYGFGPDEESRDWIRRELGGDSPIDAGLRGGETMRLGPRRRIEILHLPGHTPGHLGIWDPENEAAIIIDAALETGIYDREGNRLIPPRYFDAPKYQSTIRKLRTLRPQHLLTAHYPPMQGEEALAFLDRSLDFTEQLHRVVSEGLSSGTTDLWELTRQAVARLGPYPEFGHELGAGVRAHMALL